MNTIERQLQTCLNKIENWATHNGFKFSKAKTQCVHFCNLRKQHDDPVLSIYNTPIKVVEEAKFLGVIFDRKLNFISHITYVKNRCIKALNLLKMLSNTTWGGDRTTLLKIYRALIRSKLDYGSIIYGSARKSYIGMLDTIHHQGLLLALGAFRTSPIESLYAEAHESSLQLRRDKLSLQYYTKLAANVENPAYETVVHPNYPDKYEEKPKAIKPFGLRVRPLAAESNITIENVKENKISTIPSWTMEKPNILFDLKQDRKNNITPEIHRSNFNELK